MSYARWSDGDWYAFWHVDSGDTKNEQMLAMWHIKDKRCPQYNYKQLKDQRNAVWLDLESNGANNRADFDEIIGWFIEDVNESFTAKHDQQL